MLEYFEKKNSDKASTFQKEVMEGNVNFFNRKLEFNNT